MSHVCRAEIIQVHLIPKLGDGSIDEEGWVAAAGAAPHNIGWHVVIEGRGFGYDAFTFGRGGEVGAYVVEFLLLRSQCTFLETWYQFGPVPSANELVDEQR